MRRLLLGSATVTLALAAHAATVGAQGSPAGAAHAAAHLKYGPAPAALPPGATVAVVEGDPNETGPFTLRLRMPSGYRIAPHSHPTDETITVIKGELDRGMGDKWDSSKLEKMKPGASGTMKAGENHYARAKGNTEIEVKSTGPFEVNYVNPADDPRNKKASKPKS